MAKKEIRYKSALPYYAAGLAWLVYGLFFQLYRLSDILICAIISVLVFILIRRLAPDKTVQTEVLEFDRSGDSYADEVIAKGRDMLSKLYGIMGRVEKDVMKNYIRSMYETGQKIYNYVASEPKKASALSKFGNYYFPETIEILNAYMELDRLGATGENINKTKEKIESTIVSMDEVFKKQLDVLLYDKAFDVQTDIKVLEGLLKEEGLKK